MYRVFNYFLPQLGAPFPLTWQKLIFSTSTVHATLIAHFIYFSKSDGQANNPPPLPSPRQTLSCAKCTCSQQLEYTRRYKVSSNFREQNRKNASRFSCSRSVLYCKYLSVRRLRTTFVISTLDSSRDSLSFASEIQGMCTGFPRRWPVVELYVSGRVWVVCASATSCFLTGKGQMCSRSGLVLYVSLVFSSRSWS